MNPENRPHRSSGAALVIGIGTILLGLALTLEHLFKVDILGHAMSFWPLGIIIFGVFKIYRASKQGASLTGPIVITALGLLLTLNKFADRDMGELIGPLVVIGMGVMIVLFSLKKRRGIPRELMSTPGFLQGTAILSGFRRRPTGALFQGGELTAIFGGFEVDLRQVEMEGETARLDVFVLFGGGDLRVPEHWEVVNHATAIAGGIENKTFLALPPEVPRKRLLLTGMALFGGIEVKH